MSVAANLGHFVATIPQAPANEIDVGRVRLFGVRGWVAYRLDHDQRRLRLSHGIGPALRLDLLDTLMSLPLGLPVPLQAVSRVHQQRLRSLPNGAVTWSQATVTRRLAPPVAPLLAMVRGRDWARGLRAASRFAMYCSRLMMISELPRNEDAALAEASFYGVGVALQRNGSLTMVLEPEPLTDWQPTAAWWWFTEEVYRVAEETR